MNPLRLIVSQLGFFTRAHAYDIGYDDREIAFAVRSKLWLRVRRGYYTFPDIWSAANAEARHLIRARAVMDSLGERVALSHVSGCLAHGMDTWGVDLTRVHVTRLDGGAGRLEGDVVHHTGRVEAHELREAHGVRVLAPARCALETGTTGTAESGLVTLNSGLHLRRFTFSELEDQYTVMRNWPGKRRLHFPVGMCTDQAESVGESRGLWLFWRQRLPRPVLQYEVWLDGELIGRTDWAWPAYRLLGEFDGRGKYGRLLKPGQDPGEAVFLEKRREDALREATGFSMVRLVWDDLGTPDVTAARLRTRLGLAS